MTSNSVLIAAGLFFCTSIHAAHYFISPTGSDEAAGSQSAPFATIAKAADLVQPGDTIFVLPGTYKYKGTTNLLKSGTADRRICLFAYDKNVKPVLDYIDAFNSSNLPANDAIRAFFLTGSYWHIRGLDIYRAPDNGIKIEGSHNIIENCVFRDCYDSGLQIGLAKNSVTNKGDSAAYNLILNCDSFNNCDSHKSGGNADGFANKLCSGPGNHFKGCRAWNNSDDGWDLYQNEHPTLLEECWTWHAGDASTLRDNKAGNGNGFKMGGNSSYGCSNIAYRCIAFDNHYVSGGGKGFDQNDNNKGQIVINCTSFKNTKNYSFGSGSVPHTISNCVSFNFFEKHISSLTQNILSNNSWQIDGVTADAEDFISIAEEMAKAPRLDDGRLPVNGFCKLVSSSDCIDKGTVSPITWQNSTIEQVYTGKGPDIGAYEYGATPVQYGSFAKKPGTTAMYCSPSAAHELTTLFFTLDKSGMITITMYGVDGKLTGTVIHASFPKGENFHIVPLADYAPGSYILKVNQDGIEQTTKFVKK
jgi:uncharacterized Zn ribbon protein